MSEETPYEVSRRLHAQGVSEEELERALRGMGLDEDEVRIVIRAGRGPGDATSPDDPAPELEQHPPAEAPTHPCPVHAQWPVAATCTRCGKFFCHQCVRDAGLARFPSSKQCPECERTHPQAATEGLGGWLLLPALQLVVSPLVLVVNLFNELGRSFDPVFTAPIAVDGSFSVLSLVYVVATAVNFFGRKRRAIPMMLGFYALGLVTAFVNMALVSWIASIAGREVPHDSGFEIGRGVISLLLWGGYFLQSERVKKTFTR